MYRVSVVKNGPKLAELPAVLFGPSGHHGGEGGLFLRAITAAESVRGGWPVRTTLENY